MIRNFRAPSVSVPRGLAGLLAMLLVACGSPAGPKPVAAPPLVQNPGKPVLVLSDANDGARVVLERAQELRVELPNPFEAVTANLAWRIAELAPGVLEVTGTRFERAPRDIDPSEGSGTTFWRLKPVAAGHVVLRFELRKPRSLDAPTATATYDVTVR